MNLLMRFAQNPHFIMHLPLLCCKDDLVSSTERKFRKLDSRHLKDVCNKHTKFQVVCDV